MRFALLAMALLVSGCMNANQPAPQPAKVQHPVEDNSIVLLVSATGQRARDLIHHVAARCWLDGVVRGAQMIVKPGGNVEIVGDQYLLVAADYVGLKGARSRWKLTGTALLDPFKKQRLITTLDRAVKTGRTACPPLA